MYLFTVTKASESDASFTVWFSTGKLLKVVWKTLQLVKCGSLKKKNMRYLSNGDSGIHVGEFQFFPNAVTPKMGIHEFRIVPIKW